MVKRENILDCYRFLLDRLPENDDVVDAKCQAATLEDVVADMVVSPEFLNRHKVAIAQYLLAHGSRSK